MATNIEIKARVRDWAELERRVEILADGPGRVLHQHDVFFNAAQGRLKLRVLADDQGYLVYYRRADQAGPKASEYVLAPSTAPAALEEALAAALGVRGVVDKQRVLYMVGQTRVHLDQVDGLGAYMELEVVLEPGQGAEQGARIAEDLMAQLGIDPGDLVHGAYIDLLEAAQAESTVRDRSIEGGM